MKNQVILVQRKCVATNENTKAERGVAGDRPRLGEWAY